MCFSAGLDPEIIRRIEAVSGLRPEPGAADIFPGDLFSAAQRPLIPVITGGSAMRLRPMHWILVPSWITDSNDMKAQKIWSANIRIEEAETKPLYRPLVESRRCVACFSHFFEWRHEGRKRIRYRIGFPEGAPLFMPGLYTTGEIDGAPYASFGIATMEARGEMRHIHSTKLRQPVVVDWEGARTWLDPKRSFDAARRDVLGVERSGEFLAGVDEVPPGPPLDGQQELF